MKAVEKNISRHENGTLYFVARRGGKLTWRSLRTKNLEQARRLVRERCAFLQARDTPPSARRAGSAPDGCPREVAFCVPRCRARNAAPTQRIVGRLGGTHPGFEQESADDGEKAVHFGRYPQTEEVVIVRFGPQDDRFLKSAAFGSNVFTVDVDVCPNPTCDCWHINLLLSCGPSEPPIRVECDLENRTVAKLVAEQSYTTPRLVPSSTSAAIELQRLRGKKAASGTSGSSFEAKRSGVPISCSGNVIE